MIDLTAKPYFIGVAMKHLITLKLFFLMALTSTSCKNKKQEPITTLKSETVSLNESPKFCAAMRGNGTHVISHFGSLARIVEDYGVIDGMAGGSSGSISSFFYESILLNPTVESLTGESKQAAIRLMLKSMVGSASGPKMVS